MGFGFNMSLIIVGPLLIIILLVGAIFFDKTEKLFRILFLSILGIIILISFTQWLFSKKTVTSNDITGTYVIDRTKYPGKQAEWQYKTYKIKITKDHQIILLETLKDGSLKKYSSSYKLNFQYKYPRLIVLDYQPHHILNDNPTLYRTSWSFYYVFKSPKFGNMFFIKE